MPLIPPDVSEKDVREHANRCAHRAGHCERDGQPRMARKIVSQPTTEAYRRGFDLAFGRGDIMRRMPPPGPERGAATSRPLGRDAERRGL